MMSNVGNTRTTGSVLVLGDGTGAFLSTIRSLGRRGLAIDIGWHSANAAALKSRYVRRSINQPRPPTTGWIDGFVEVLEREQYELVVATNEQSIRPLHEQRERLAPLTRFGFHEPETFEVVFDKVRSTQLAADVGVKTPAGYLVETEVDLRGAAAAFGFPFVAKPVSSYAAGNLQQRRNVVTLRNAEQVEQLAEQLPTGGPIFAQEYFVGTGVGVELIAADGKILYAFQHRRVHEPPHGGASSYRKSVPLNPELLQASERIIAALRYTGVMMVEFLHNESTSDWRFVEINARFWGSLPLAIAAGADFPWFLYQLLVNNRRDFSPGYRDGLYCRNLIGDLKWAGQNFRSNRSDATLHTVSLAQSLRELLNVPLLREVNDTFVCDDLRPAISELTTYVNREWDRRWNAVFAAAAGSKYFRPRHTSRLQQQIAQAKNIVFVCYGNICRSPFAEGYLRSLVDSNLQVSSMGVKATAGCTPPPEAVEAAAAWGVDLAARPAVLMNAAIVDHADIVFSFDERVHRDLLRSYPAARHKIHRFGLLLPGGALNIPDPYQRPREVFDEVYRTIANSLNGAWKPHARPAPVEEPSAT